jgi:hypothetical protein
VGVNAVYKRNITVPAENRTPMLKQTRYDRRRLWPACMSVTRARRTAFTPVFVKKARGIFYCCTPLRNGRHHRLYAALMSSALQQAVRRSPILSVIHILFIIFDLLLQSQTKQKRAICDKNWITCYRRQCLRCHFVQHLSTLRHETNRFAKQTWRLCSLLRLGVAR